MEEQKQIRCAIYTRKSTDEGLEKEFNTLEAQREAGENFVMSMKHQGWVILPDHYDDGGFSGGNLKRPALKRLMADVEKGKVDMIVVYKIDRLRHKQYHIFIMLFDHNQSGTDCGLYFGNDIFPLNKGINRRCVFRQYLP